MKINTIRFGEIDISEDKLLVFGDGVLGFEQCRNFALITTEETDPFMWLQAVEQPDIALAVINPFRLFPDYAPSVPEAALERIGSPGDDDVLVLCVAVIPARFEKMTANLVSPVLVNARSKQGCQVVLENSTHQIKHPIYDAVQILLNGGGKDAGPHA